METNGYLVFQQGGSLVDQKQVQDPVVGKVVFGRALGLREPGSCVIQREEKERVRGVTHVLNDAVLADLEADRFDGTVEVREGDAVANGFGDFFHEDAHRLLISNAVSGDDVSQQRFLIDTFHIGSLVRIEERFRKPAVLIVGKKRAADGAVRFRAQQVRFFMGDAKGIEIFSKTARQACVPFQN